MDTLPAKHTSLSAAHLTDALSVGLVGTWVWDLVNDKVTADKNMASMFGLNAKEAAAGLPIARFVEAIHSEDRPRVKEEIEKAVKEKSSYEVEYRVVGRTGAVRWVIARGQLETDENGKPFRFPGIAVDTTASKVAEEAARESASELRFMAESMPQKVFTARPDGATDYINPQWSEFTGRSHEDLMDGGWVRCLYPDDEAKSMRQWKRSLKTGQPLQVEQRFRRADGAYRWHLTRAHAMHDSKGKITKWIGSSTDISEQKQLELNLDFLSTASKTLSASLDFASALEKVAKQMVPAIADWCVVDLKQEDGSIQQLAIAHKDPEKIAWANKLRRKFPPKDNRAGASKVMLTGEAEYYPSISDDILKAAAESEEHLQLLRSVGFSSAITVPLKSKNETVGTITLVSVEQKRNFTKTDLETAEELAERASQAITNASLYAALEEELEKRKMLEAELRLVNEALETKVKERTLRLEDMNQNLSRSNQELQDFAYVASHDLQEPLRKIQAFGNLLEEEYSQALGEGNDYLDRMRGAAHRMSVLIEDLLSFSRVTTQARPFDRVDLREVALEVVSDLEARIRDTNGKIHIGKLPTVEADATQMRQLFQNLLANALKFHKEGVPPVIHVSARKLGPRWRIYVKDNGIGFEEKYLDRIFAVFQRLHGRDAYEGTGIGLAVCRKIAERHNGTIIATSKHGEGSTFTITLPVEQDE